MRREGRVNPHVTAADHSNTLKNVQWLCKVCEQAKELEK